MSDHPQTRAFTEAAENLKAERYWSYNTVAQKKEFLYALGEVMREVAYHLDKHQVLDPAALKAFDQASATQVPAALGISAELVLMSALQQRIDNIHALDE